MKDVFISYKSEEIEEASWVKSVLEENGISCWMAPACIPGGSSYAEEIPKAIRDAKALVLVLSSKSQSSRWVSREVDLALNEGKVVMPFMLENCALKDDFNFYLTNVQRYAAYENKAAAMEKMIRELKAIVGISADTNGAVAGGVPATEKGAVGTAKQTTPEKKSNKTLFIILGVAAAGVALLIGALIISLIIALFSGGDDTSENNSSMAVTQSSSAVSEESIAVVMSDNLFDFTFELDGTVYKLPCDFQQFVDNGWTISSSGYSGDSLLKGNGEQSFYMSKDGKRINVSAYNLSGNAKAIHDCKIGEITCESGNGPDFKIAKGITSASSFDEIQTAFGSPNEQHSGEGYQRIQYYQEDSDMAGVKIYIYEDTRYSSVTIRNYVKTAEDNTETNTDVPSYLSQYTAPTELGNDIFAGKISVDNSVYQIPSSLSAFLDDGWQLSRKPGSVVAGGADYVKAAKDGKTLELYIINYAKYQTTPENCAVYKVSVYEENGVGAILPCAGKAITIGMTQSELESILPESFDNYAGTYSTNYTYSEYKERDFSLSITVDNETGLVSGISVTCRTWDYS